MSFLPEWNKNTLKLVSHGFGMLWMIFSCTRLKISDMNKTRPFRQGLDGHFRNSSVFSLAHTYQNPQLTYIPLYTYTNPRFIYMSYCVNKSGLQAFILKTSPALVFCRSAAQSRTFAIFHPSKKRLGQLTN